MSADFIPLILRTLKGQLRKPVARDTVNGIGGCSLTFEGTELQSSRRFSTITLLPLVSGFPFASR
jgi:hypothetical protein